jgi:ParB-like chromosome segregation protein Spo0J
MEHMIQHTLFDAGRQQTREHPITTYVRGAVADITSLSLAERVEVLNQLKLLLHSLSPFVNEPVDCVLWVTADEVQANDYNPNSVAPPEMELLRLSIEADGFTQPIVTWEREPVFEVVDGFHRNRVGKECESVRERVSGYLPIVVIQGDRQDRGDRIAATIRHNRARGKHRVDAMSEIVLELKRRNWSDAKIGKQLGMDPDEVLRLTQITGLAEMFADREFSRAWEADVINDGDNMDITGEVDATDI